MTSARLIDYLGKGTLADRPDPLDIHPNSCGFYAATDTNQLFYWVNAAWTEIPFGTIPASVADLLAVDGTDGQIIRRVAGEWVADDETVPPTGIPDVPDDGNMYVREHEAWTQLPAYPAPGIEEAPEDGTKYVRKDGAWVAESAPPAVPTTENIQDIVGAMLIAGDNITLNYDDAAGTVEITGEAGGGGGGGGGGSNPYMRDPVKPLAADFVVQKDGGATAVIADGNRGLILSQPGPSTGIQFARPALALPAAPFKILMRTKRMIPRDTGYSQCLVARNSANGRIVINGSYSYTSHLIQRWNHYTSYEGARWGPMNFINPPEWLGVKHDGANLIFMMSADGDDWEDQFTEPLAEWMGGCDQIGFGYLDPGHAMKMICHSFEVIPGL